MINIQKPTYPNIIFRDKTNLEVLRSKGYDSFTKVLVKKENYFIKTHNLKIKNSFFIMEIPRNNIKSLIYGVELDFFVNLNPNNKNIKIYELKMGVRK